MQSQIMIGTAKPSKLNVINNNIQEKQTTTLIFCSTIRPYFSHIFRPYVSVYIIASRKLIICRQREPQNQKLQNLLLGATESSLINIFRGMPRVSPNAKFRILCVCSNN